MTLLEFLKEKITYLMSLLFILITTFLILLALSPKGNLSLPCLISVFFILGSLFPLIHEYIKKKSFYGNLLFIFDELDKKNLIAETITPPTFKEGRILFDVVKESNKAMLEEINKYKYLQEEYREYIELWVHEIKTPIASSRLITQNNKSDSMNSINEELGRIEAYIEQVLFYSRSNNVEKDYIIKEINLEKLCFSILKKNSLMFIKNKIGIETNGLDLMVYSDSKWLEFIINQILTNSIKYLNKTSAHIKIVAKEQKNGIVLSIEDNGIGIQKSEVPLIWNKGFTGTNGRKTEYSTGMGLYICRKLCDKLGLSIDAQSEQGIGTTINIVFPINSMTNFKYGD